MSGALFLIVNTYKPKGPDKYNYTMMYYGTTNYNHHINTQHQLKLVKL